MEQSRKRKAKENKPVLAICYDFDKTLSPDDMQAQGYIQSVYKEDVASFWQESNKLAVIVSLNGSCSFSTTHTIIKELSEIKVDLWEQDEINTLLQIALENNQVRYILNDLDVKFFYKQVIKQLNKPNENSKSIKQLFESNGEQK